MNIPFSKLAMIVTLVVAHVVCNCETIPACRVAGLLDGPLDSSKKGNSSTLVKDSSDPQSVNPGKQDQPAQGVTFSNPVSIKWKVNAKIRGGSGPAQNMLVTLPVPTAWPEQSVAIAEDDIPVSIARVKYRDLDSGVKQLVALIPRIKPREEITISMTFLVSTSQINPPPDPSVFVRPKTNHRSGKPYIGVGPQINFRDSKLRKQVKEIVEDKPDIWSEIEAIYDWVRDNIEDNTAEPKDVVSVFRARAGCNEDKVGLFVAMCRAHKIPARMVWVQGTQYAEFMLVDSEANPHWFPCSVGGVREFGSMSDPRIVLQKGDSIRVPEKESRQKFVAEFATCTGKSKPSVKFDRQVLSVD